MITKSKDELNQLALDTLKHINTALVETHRNEPLTRKDAVEIIEKSIDDAFSKVTVDEQRDLYKSLVIKLHPDKKFSNFPKLYDLLVQLNIEQTPFQYLNSKIEQRTNPSIFIRSSEYINSLINIMYSSLDRYYQPFKSVAKTAYWIVFLGFVLLALAGIITYKLLNLAIAIANMAIDTVTNLLTNYQYREVLNNFLEEHFKEYRQAYLQKIREQFVEDFEARGDNDNANFYRQLDDDAIYNLLIDKLFAEETQLNNNHSIDNTEDRFKKLHDKVHQQILDSATIHPLLRLKLLSISFYKSISQPLRTTEGNRFISLFIQRPLQIITYPLIIVVGTSIELTRFGISGIALIAIITSPFILIGLLGLLNMPLYVFDTCYNSITKAKHWIFNDIDNQADVEIDKMRPNQSLLMLEWYKDISLSESNVSTNDDIPPKHHKSMFSTIDDNKLALDQPNIDPSQLLLNIYGCGPP